MELLITNSSNPALPNMTVIAAGHQMVNVLGWYKLGEVEYKRRLALYLEKRRSKAG